jgi:hypothetical protein
MQRAVVILAASLLLSSWQAAAQNSDPFREETPPPMPLPAPKPPSHHEPSNARAPADPDIILWQTIQGSSNRQDFETYLRLYPDGHFADDARARIAAMPITTQLAVPSGIVTRIGQAVHHDHECRPLPEPITITQQPQHGTITVRDEMVRVSQHQTLGSGCEGVMIQGHGIYYQSAPNYKGNDSVAWDETLGSRALHASRNILVQ